jgi:hypothetical protein
MTPNEIAAHYTKVNAMTDLSMSMFASKDDLIKAQAARIAELQAALKKIAELRYAEHALEPLDEAIDIAEKALGITISE